MPGPRDKRIREAYLKHIQTLKKSKTNGITEQQAENLINSFDRQAEANKNSELFYFNSLSDEEFARQIKLYEKSDVRINPTLLSYKSGTSGKVRSESQEGIFMALFASETNRNGDPEKGIPGIKMDFKEEHYNTQFHAVQDEIDKIKLAPPAGVSEEMIVLANLGLMLRDSNMEAVEDMIINSKAQNDKSSSNEIKSDRGRTGFFANMIGLNDNRGNMNLVRVTIPEVRKQCQNALDEYAKGNKKPLAEAIRETFVQCHNLLAIATTKDNNSYYFCVEMMERSRALLESNELKYVAPLTNKQKELCDVFINERNFLDERVAVRNDLWKALSPHLFEAEKQGQTALSDPQIDRLYLRYAAMKYINQMSAEELLEADKELVNGGDPEYRKNTLLERPFSMFESLAGEQKDIFIDAIIETVIKPSNIYKDLQTKGWKDFAGKFESSISNYKDIVHNFELQYANRIKTLGKIKEDFAKQEGAEFKEVIPLIDEALETDKRINENGKPSLETLRGSVVDVFNKLYVKITALFQAQQEKVQEQMKANATSQADYDRMLVLGSYRSTVEDTEKLINQTLEYNNKKKNILDKFEELGGSLKPLENGGRRSDEDHFLEEMGLSREDIAESAQRLGITEDEYLRRIMDENTRAEQQHLGQDAESVLYEDTASEDISEQIKNFDPQKQQTLVAFDKYTKDFDRLVRSGLKEDTYKNHISDTLVNARKDLLDIAMGTKAAEKEEIQKLIAAEVYCIVQFNKFQADTKDQSIDEKLINQKIESLASYPFVKYRLRDVDSSNVHQLFGEDGAMSSIVEYMSKGVTLYSKYSDIDDLFSFMERDLNTAQTLEEGSYQRFALENAVKTREALFDGLIHRGKITKDVIRHNMAKLICCEEIARSSSLDDDFNGDTKQMEEAIEQKTQELLSDAVFQTNTKEVSTNNLLRFMGEGGIKAYDNNIESRIERCAANIKTAMNDLNTYPDMSSAKLASDSSLPAKKELLEIAKKPTLERDPEEVKMLIAKVIVCDDIIHKYTDELIMDMSMTQKSLDEKINNVYSKPAFKACMENIDRESVLDVLEKDGFKRLQKQINKFVPKEEKENFLKAQNANKGTEKNVNKAKGEKKNFSDDQNKNEKKGFTNKI